MCVCVWGGGGEGGMCGWKGVVVEYRLCGQSRFHVTLLSLFHYTFLRSDFLFSSSA